MYSIFAAAAAPLPRPSGLVLSARRLALCAALCAAFGAYAEAPTSSLTALSLEQLMDVKIVGASKYEQRQSEVAAAVSVITRQEIEAFGWRTLDEALASLPGVYSTYDRQYSYLGTRGFGLPGDLNTRHLVTINGNRVNDPLFDLGPFGRQFPLDMDLVERIEFIPGPGGAVYGQNAIFGVVNVVTRTGADIDGTELALSQRSRLGLREARASWGKKFADGTVALLSVSDERATGQDLFMQFGSSGVSGIARGMDGERDREFYGRISHGAWSFEHVFGNHNKMDPTGAYTSDPLTPDGHQGDRYALTQLQYQSSLAGDMLMLSARLFHGREDYLAQLTYGNRLSLPSNSQWHGVELRAVSTTFAGHKLMAGIEAQNNTRQDQAVSGNVNPADDFVLARDGYRIGFSLQDEWRVSETLSATVGLRHDRNNVTGSKLSPRGALIWQASPHTTFKAMYGRAHRAPNVYERDYGDGITQLANLTLKGESIDTLELVADHRMGVDLGLRGTLYQWNIHDLITLGTEPNSGIAQYQSGGDVKAFGVELSFDKTWGTRARARGSLALQDSSYRDGTKLDNSPRMLAKFNLSAPLPVAGLRLGYELQYDGARLSVNGTRLGGYAVSNVHLGSASLIPGAELSFSIHNLLDKRYAHPGSDTNWQNAFDQDGRSFGAKLSFKF